MPENKGEMKLPKENALKESRAGNDAYKKKKFDAAIKHYSKAMELDDENILFITDRSKVYFEMGKYNECIADCIRAVERGQKLNLDVELIAKALTQKGLAYQKLVKCAKDYDLAIEALDMACKMHENQDTFQKLDHAKSAKEELEQKEHLSDRERTLGDECFKNKEIEEAVKHFTEAIKLNPSNAQAYGNRALCYNTLNRLDEGLKDAEKCIELDPTLARGYLQKGSIEFKNKEDKKALETYETGLKHAKEKKELTRSRDIVVKEIQDAAKLDPEIQNILSDPIMRQVLIDFQQNCSDAQEHAKNPRVLEKLLKLSTARLI